MNIEIHPDLDKILKKLSKKDKTQFEAVISKMEQIATGSDHYKNLRAPLNEYKRVHINASFVLIFKIDKDRVIFRYYEHHDKIYKRRY
jgi:YafQ family addiction module toxin component